MSELRFDGKVAVVTGAGAGLGRAYALLFASRGAKVIVNDLGGGRHGEGKSSKAADAVVEEIKQTGGIAAPDYNSVIDGEKIIETAIKTFGRIDILVNNAGILRDKSLIRMSDADWDLIHSVHLKGSFKCTKAAFEHFRKQRYGRIVMTSSNSGLMGNFGQANYSAAKMGLVGLSNTIAIEGGRHNIHCNVIVPTAASRLTEDILPPDLYSQLKPELIAPVVAFLCHESCTENGSIIEAAAGWAGRWRLARAPGSVLRANVNDPVLLETVHKQWPVITNMEGSRPYDSIQEVTGALMESLSGSTESSGHRNDQADLYAFNEKDIILYNLGVGANLKQDFNLLYENSERFGPLPTFFIMPAMQAVFANSDLENVVKGKTISLAQILHGEHYIEILGPLPKEGNLRSVNKIVDVLDKGSGALIINEVETFNSAGELIVRNQVVAFAVGAGGFNGPRTSDKLIPTFIRPQRAADAVASEKTSLDQAALYRLSGDRNPLHIDPSMAELGGFKQPILHGLCSLGISVKLVLRTFTVDYDLEQFKACKARFMKPVIPGQTLRVDMWQQGNRICFETVVVETGTTVIGGAYVDLKEAKMQLKSNTADNSKLQSNAIFQYISDKIKEDVKKAKSVGGVFLYNILKDGKTVKQWTVDLNNAEVMEGTPKGKPDVTLTLSDADLIEMATGKLQPQVAFMRGKLKVAGNIMLAQKLTPFLKVQVKL